MKKLYTLKYGPVFWPTLYCAPAWHGFCSAFDYSRLNSFLRRCIKLGYTGRHSATITDMFQDADDVFFVRYYLIKLTFFTRTYSSVHK